MDGFDYLLVPTLWTHFFHLRLLAAAINTALPLLALAPFQASAPAKIRLALAGLVKSAAMPIVGQP